MPRRFSVDQKKIKNLDVREIDCGNMLPLRWKTYGSGELKQIFRDITDTSGNKNHSYIGRLDVCT